MKPSFEPQSSKNPVQIEVTPLGADVTNSKEFKVDSKSATECINVNSDESEEVVTAEEHLKLGKKALKENRIDESVEHFSRGVETKLQELGAFQEKHPSMGIYYLEYGNALLKKAENSNELFQDTTKFVEQDSGDDSASSALYPINEEEEEEKDQTAAVNVVGQHMREESISDEQVLELARMCFSTLLSISKELKALPGSKADDERFDKVVEDYAFVHLRLGDLLLIEEKFEDASIEYQRAINLFKEHNLLYTLRIPAVIALGQAHLYNNKATLAVEIFQEAFQLVTNQLAGVTGAVVPADKIQDFEDTKEDLRIQIAEIMRNIDNGLYDEIEASQKIDDKKASTLLERAGVSTSSQIIKNPFDESQLKTETGELPKAIHLGIIKSRRTEEGDHKRHRVDLSKKQIDVKKEAHQSSNMEVQQEDKITK